MPPPLVGGGRGDAEGGSGNGVTGAPVPAPVAAPDQGSSQTNVQEAGVDEPDWVKLSGTTLFAVSGGRLAAFAAGGDRARVLGTLDLGGFSHELLVRGDRALVIAGVGFGGVVAAQVARGRAAAMDGAARGSPRSTSPIRRRCACCGRSTSRAAT